MSEKRTVILVLLTELEIKFPRRQAAQERHRVESETLAIGFEASVRTSQARRSPTIQTFLCPSHPNVSRVANGGVKSHRLLL